MSEPERFAAEVAANIRGLAADGDVQALSRIWVREVTRYRYSYNFTWMGRPIIQTPQDMVALQEIIWRTRPDVVVETGIAHGGSLVYLRLADGAARRRGTRDRRGHRDPAAQPCRDRAPPDGEAHHVDRGLLGRPCGGGARGPGGREAGVPW